MSIRKFQSNIKSLMHFDFPYYAEPNDGLRNEISSPEIWKRNGNVKFVGEEAPNDEIILGTPKFGYRCPSFSGASDFLSCTNTQDIFTFSQSGSYEIEFFLRVTALNAGRVFAFKKHDDSYSLALSLLNDGKFSILGVTSSAAISLNTWTHLLARFTNSKIFVYLNGTQIISCDFSGIANNECASFELGGFSGQVDEFILRHSLSSSVSVPSQPYQAHIKPEDLGGFGSSQYGSLTLAASCVLNSYAAVSSISGNKISVGSWVNGKFGAPNVDDEVMIHATLAKGTSYTDAGNFTFRKIAAISGNTITLDSALNDFAALVNSYYLQIITVPNLANLTINEKVIISPKKYENNCGGLVAFRVADNFNLNGQIITSGQGPIRNDNLQITHAGLIENFILNTGGGIFIAAKNFNASSNARIGATWDGSLTGGAGGYSSNSGIDGGAGYGGGGGGWPGAGSYHPTTGGAGGVGGGGGGGAGSATDSAHRGNGWDAGASNATGGLFGWERGVLNSGGTQGKTPGGNGDGGGGGAGGCAVQLNVNGLTTSGANVIIIAEKFSCDNAAISTGGKGGKACFSGGGTGFCYLAVKEMI